MLISQHIYFISVFKLILEEPPSTPNLPGSLHCSDWILRFLWIIIIFQLRVMKWMGRRWGVCVNASQSLSDWSWQCNISCREPAPFTVTWDKTISKANKAEGLLWRREQPPQPRGPLQPRWLPVQQRSRRWFRPGSFVGVRMGPWLKQAKLSAGGPPAPPLPLRSSVTPPTPLTCNLPTSKAPGNPGDGRVGGPCLWVRGPEHAGRAGKGFHALFWGKTKDTWVKKHSVVILLGLIQLIFTK